MRRRALDQERLTVEAQMRVLRQRMAGIQDDLKAAAAQEQTRRRAIETERKALSKIRKAD